MKFLSEDDRDVIANQLKKTASGFGKLAVGAAVTAITSLYLTKTGQKEFQEGLSGSFNFTVNKFRNRNEED